MTCAAAGSHEQAVTGCASGVAHPVSPNRKGVPPPTSRGRGAATVPRGRYGALLVAPGGVAPLPGSTPDRPGALALAPGGAPLPGVAPDRPGALALAPGGVAALPGVAPV